MSRFVLVILPYLLAIPYMSGQSQVSFNEYFMASLVGIAQSDTIEFIDFNTTWIEQIDFRTETDDWDIDRQQYLLRIKPSSKKVNTALKDLLQSYKNKQSLRSSTLVKKHIDNVYDRLLELYEEIMTLKLSEELLIVLKDQEKVLQKLLSSKQNSITDLLDIKNEILILENNILESKLKLNNLEPNWTSIKWSGLISHEEIAIQLSNLDGFTLGSLANTKSLLTKDIIAKEIQLEKAEANKYFDFLQFAYRGPNTDPFREKFSVTAAFEIPFSNKSRMKIAELKNEIFDIDMKDKLDDQRRQDEIESLRSDLRISISKYRNLSAKQNVLKKEMQSLVNQIENIQMKNPMLRLGLIKKEIRMASSLMTIEVKMIQDYIRYLSLTEILYQNPKRNYLKS